MAEEERTRRWQRFESQTRQTEPIQALRQAIAEVRKAPTDFEARRRLRGLAAELGMWEQLALLLADEARAAERPEVASAFFEELADVYENLDLPLEMITAMEALVAHAPDVAEHHDRLAWLYRKAGAWQKAADSFKRVAELASDDRARAALRAAGKLYRDNGRLDAAVAMYRSIVERRPSDQDAWRALDDLLQHLGRWRELAEVRGAMAARVDGVEKAVLLRAQARAFEQAGDVVSAADLVKRAAGHAPEDVSGLVDYATVLAREGRTHEAAELLTKRIDNAIASGASGEHVAALRMRLVRVLEDAGDMAVAAAALEELLEVAPGYLPALERLAAQAAQTMDPRVHAEALLRYAAALPDGEDRSGAVIAAGRRFRDAGDHGAAVRAFQDAIELAPDDEDLRADLDDVRTALAVERAADESSAGDTTSAERRLRKILDAHPHHIEANLALVELLTAARRHAAAAEHLRETLASAPEDTPSDRLAPLVHCFAEVMTALGDGDEAHQLLHEAHHLDRKSLLITLALGESCFARKLWREATRHLGSLAEHPDAPRHADAVARGLVHAAQAEVRALRPANALKHYQGAAKLDPRCTPAWHALAEAAVERGDLIYAADCFEKEAIATTEPRDRLRLFDAVGDLAFDVIGDPARAERCWIQVLEIAAVPLLQKLLSVQRRRGSGVSRGATCERLASLTTDARAAKDLLGEAAEAYSAGGDFGRALDCATRLIDAHRHDIDAVSRATSIALAAGEVGQAAIWLRAVLGSERDDEGADTHDDDDGDPRRAALWRRLGDAESSLGKQHAAMTAYRRAVAVAPESDGALAARRALVDISSTTGKPAYTARVALVEADQEPEDILAWARELARNGAVDDARAAYELSRALGVELAESDQQFVAAHPLRVMASDETYGAPLTEAERRELIDDPADAPLADLFEMLGEVTALLCPDGRTALGRAGLTDAKRVTPTSNSAAVAMYPKIASALGGPPTLLYSSARADDDLTLLLAAPPVVVFGRGLTDLRARSQSESKDREDDAELRFLLGQIVELSRPRRVFAAGSTDEQLSLLIDGLWHAFGRHDDFVEPVIAAEADRLRSTLPVALRRRLTERLVDVQRSALDLGVYASACDRAADRAGMLACGHVDVAIELAGGRTAATHLVRLAASRAYLAARRKLRPRR